MSEVSAFISALERLEEVMNSEDRVMTCSEAAYVLGKSQATVSRYICEGKLHKSTANGLTGVLARDVYKLIRR